MTGSAPGERAEAEGSAIARLRDAAIPLVVLLVLGFALRLIIAYGLLPGSGFRVDALSFNGWASALAANGPWGLYDQPGFLDYTPGYLYVLWFLGVVAHLLGGPDAVPGELLKLPPMLADLGLAVGVFLLVGDLAGRRRAGLVAAALVLLVPVTWIDSAIWSQVDSFGTLVLVFAVWRLGRGDHVGGTLLTTIAAIIKPQYGILIPLAAVLIIRRDFAPRERGWWIDDPIDWAIRFGGLLCGGLAIVPVFGHLGPFIGMGTAVAAVVLYARDRSLGFGLGRLAGILLVGLGTAQAICLPFGISFATLARQIGTTAAEYPYITVNAYNPWALVGQGGNGLAATGSWLQDVATTAKDGTLTAGVTILGIPALLVGTLALVATIAILAAFVWRRGDRRTLLVALTVLAIAFFVLPTRVHERYMYPFFALGAVLAALNWRWAVVYAVLAIAATMNLYGILTNDFYQNTGLDPMLNAFGGVGARLGDAIRSFSGVMLASVLSAGGLLAAFIFLARPTPEEEDWELAFDDADGYAPSRGLAADALAAAGRSAGGMVGAAGSAAGSAAAGARDWLRRARFDRSALLRGEAGGKLDRLDIWLFVVLVVASLCLRTFRLGEPFGMHFDEVYHARTAAEFLQDWRYGKPHDIYEYTHPHLAKYAIAGGLVAFGNDQVTSTSNLGTGVRDAALEARWDDTTAAGTDTRGGERLYVATGSEVRIYDLLSRTEIGTLKVPGAVAVALDTQGRRLFVATQPGDILQMSTDMPTAKMKSSLADGSLTLARYASTVSPVSRIWVIDQGSMLVGAQDDGTLATLDVSGDSGTLIASGPLAGVQDVLDAGSFPALVAAPSKVTDPAAVAAELATILGGTAADYETALRSSAPQVTLRSQLGTLRPQVDQAVAAGKLTGVSVENVARVAVADTAGVQFVDPTTLHVISSVDLPAGATSLVNAPVVDSGSLYATSGSTLATITLPKDDASAPTLATSVWMPAQVTRVTFDEASGLVHALGRTTDGTGWTIYVVEPRGNSVFADAKLPFEPVAWATDVDAGHPSTDPEQILAFASDGSSAAVSIGQHAFAWRLPGVIAGAIMAGLLFLLARILFRRRTVGLLVGLFGLIDGMFFVQQRIAMNDTYVALFVVAGVTLFAAIWTGFWKSRLAFWIGMPIVGVLMGLGLASKWVALYAIGALGVLVLVRSALGRVIVILGLAAGTGVLGYMAISVPTNATSGGDLIFLLIMIALTVAAAVMAVLHPIAWTPDEVRIAIGGPVAAGALVGLVALPLRLTPIGFYLAILCFGVAALAAAGFWVGARMGMGPLAPLPDEESGAAILPPPSDAPDGWLLPGRWMGTPIAWAVFSLLLIPVAVYVISYIPWAIGSGGSPQIFPAGTPLIGQWPPGHTGQTLWDLTKSMYSYHNDLRATHAASSPWWAWTFDLKPVWFYSSGDNFANGTSGAIYDGGNIVLWWLSIPAMAFVAFQAFKRRSNQLGLIAIVIGCMWLAWARIDRATFQYHYYSTLPFVMLALAYFVAEIWHGPSRRTWLLARASAVGALLLPVVLWFGRGPLCAIAEVAKVNANSEACTSAAKVSLTLSLQLVGAVSILIVGGGLVVWQMLRIDRQMREGAGPDEIRPASRITLLTGIVSLALLAGAWFLLPSAPLGSGLVIPGELMAVVLLLVLGPLAWIAATAKNPRRFVTGILVAALISFLVFYPNWSALPLPSQVFNYYQGLLPTWIYSFQFAVNLNEPYSPPLLNLAPALLMLSALGGAAVMSWVAWTWQVSLAERRLDEEALAAEPEA